MDKDCIIQCGRKAMSLTLCRECSDDWDKQRLFAESGGIYFTLSEWAVKRALELERKRVDSIPVGETLGDSLTGLKQPPVLDHLYAKAPYVQSEQVLSTCGKCGGYASACNCP